METELINALKELGAVAWLGILSWQAIKIRRNGGNNASLEKKIDALSERVYGLSQSVARIEGHLEIKSKGDK
ncbi:MAG: hypothetical protein GTO41_13235 [Burkholderiales bacterium]|nr:hypothetical protein [Burkholderiales bacterium]